MKILCVGETLLRHATTPGRRFNDLSFTTCIGGAETNVAVNLSQMGMDVSLFTKLPDHALGHKVISYLKEYDVNVEHIKRNKHRLGVYYLETGIGVRSSSVIYDRSYSAMTYLQYEEIDMEDLFKDVDLFMTTGITLALNKEVRKTLIMMMKYAYEHNIKVAYDQNYRAKLWNEEEAGKTLREVLPYIHILSANELDFINFLHLSKSSWKNNCKQVINKYPQLEAITCTKRKIISSSTHELTGLLYTSDYYQSKTYHIDDIVDRIGTGDAYFAGIIYGLLNQFEEEKTVSYACASAVLKHSVYGDANQFNEREILEFMDESYNCIKR